MAYLWNLQTRYFKYYNWVHSPSVFNSYTVTSCTCIYELSFHKSLHLQNWLFWYIKQRVMSSKRRELEAESDLKSYDMRILLDFTNINIKSMRTYFTWEIQYILMIYVVPSLLLRQSSMIYLPLHAVGNRC